MAPPYRYCNKPYCRRQGERDMRYFIQGGDPSGRVLGAQAVRRALSCGFTEEEVVYYCLIQGKRFGQAAQGLLGCRNERPSSCNPGTYMPRAYALIGASRYTIIKGESVNISWSVTGHYNSINISNIGSVDCTGSRNVSPSRTTTYTITVCNNGGCTSRSITVNVQDPPPSISYFTASPTTIIRGQTTTLRWSISGTVSSANISSVGNVSSTGSINVSPFNNITYTLSAYGPSGSDSTSINVVVYEPPVITLSLDNSTIITGSSTRLRWSTTGDASSASISPGIGTSNITSSAIVSPTVTTTYTAYASGLGGSDSDQITLTVIQPPSATISGPISVNYGQTVTLNCRASNATQSAQLLAKYYYADGSSSNYEIVDQFSPSTYINSDSVVLPPYNNIGPTSIEFQFYVVGQGGLNDTDTEIVRVNIDTTPDVIDIPESDDKIKSEEPVVSPDVEVTTEQLLINDIDIPVEVKADYPVQVEIDNSNVFVNIRRLE